jgi:phosphoenolpyruvate-protein phosphotransferase
MGEVALHGVSAAPGVAIGNAVAVDPVRSLGAVEVAPAERANEVARARDALALVASDLEAIGRELRDGGRREEADIVDTGALMALDPELGGRVEGLVRDMGLSATDALREAAAQMALELAQLADPELAQRADDVRSIGRRAAARAAGISEHVHGIVVASTLGPADVAELASRATGFALAQGGVTSHAAIVARSLGLPMVVGVGEELLAVGQGDELIVDGDRGVVVRSPDAEMAAFARRHMLEKHDSRALAISRRTEHATTTDGRSIRVLANSSTVGELEEALQQGAEGVGLLRTELLFLEAIRWPNMERQIEVLRPVLTRLEGMTATVRLFDFGGDKTPPFLRGVAARGIQLLLEAPDALRTHLRAVIEAGRGARLRLLVPMVTSAAQMRVVREMIDDEVQLGAMIETPQAAAGAAAIAHVSDFLSIGTNDLTQLVLGLDREQSRHAPVTDPRVLRLIAETMRAARESNIVVDVCGEAASDPVAMPALIGLGADELSVAAARVGEVRQRVRELSFATCVNEATKLLDEARDTRG